MLFYSVDPITVTISFLSIWVKEGQEGYKIHLTNEKITTKFFNICIRCIIRRHIMDHTFIKEGETLNRKIR